MAEKTKKKKRSLSEVYRQRHLPKQLREKDSILHGAVKEIDAVDKRNPRTNLAQKNAGDTDISGMMTAGLSDKEIAEKKKAIAKRARLLLGKKK